VSCSITSSSSASTTSAISSWSSCASTTKRVRGPIRALPELGGLHTTTGEPLDAV
jgi:hypothetical protein